MLVFKNRYELLALSKRYRLPKVYDLLNNIKADPEIEVACTDGKHIFINEEEFNTYQPESQFFIICHELLHILYHHTDKDYYPEKIYKHRKLLNLCQDVVINEYLKGRLSYKEPSGVYLDNVSDVLMQAGIITSKIRYSGILTTKNLYRFFNERLSIDNDEENDIINQLFPGKGDLVEETEDDRDKVTKALEEKTLSLAIENALKALKISEQMLNNENCDADKATIKEKVEAGTISTFESKTAKTTKLVSTKEMISFIESFIGNNAVIKKRNRTYLKPSRRMTLEHDLVSPGYKQKKNIKRIAIYLDVSGSMSSSLVSSLYSTLRELYKKVQFDLFIFNYSIYKIDIKTTDSIPIGGGTNIQKVLQRINDEKQDTAILITDCQDRFSLRDVTGNLMIYTNDTTFKSDNKNVSLTYFSEYI